MAEHTKQFWFYKDAMGEWRWKLLAEHSEIIADSAEGFTDLARCVHGARLVAGVASNAGMWNAVEQKWIS